jgi:hypothetical protein
VEEEAQVEVEAHMEQVAHVEQEAPKEQGRSLSEDDGEEGTPDVGGQQPQQVINYRSNEF